MNLYPLSYRHIDEPIRLAIRPIFVIHAAAGGIRFRVDDLNVAKRQSSNRPFVQNSPDDMLRDIEARSDTDRAPAVNEEQENHAALHISRGMPQESHDLRGEGNNVPADCPAQDGATRVDRRLEPRFL